MILKDSERNDVISILDMEISLWFVHLPYGERMPQEKINSTDDDRNEIDEIDSLNEYDAIAWHWCAYFSSTILANIVSVFLFNVTLFNFEWIEKNSISFTLQNECDLLLVLAKIWEDGKVKKKCKKK